MEKEGKNQKGCSGSEPDFLLRWGNRKILRCVKVKDGRNVPEKSDCLESKKITSRVDRRVVTAKKEIPSPQQPNRLNKSSDSPMKNRDSKNDGDFTGKERSEICLKGDPSWTKARGNGRRNRREF